MDDCENYKHPSQTTFPYQKTPTVKTEHDCQFLFNLQSTLFHFFFTSILRKVMDEQDDN